MKGECTERAKAVVRENLRLRVKAPNRVGLMVVADSKQLGGKDEGSRESA